MNFGQAIKSGFSNYVKFSGRARRSEYWYWILFTFLVSVVASGLDSALGVKSDTGSGPVQGIAGLALLLPTLGLFWRRMHDTGRRGTWILLNLIPVIGGIILIVFAAQDSQPGDNRFGPNPKGIVGAGHGGPSSSFGGSSPYGPPGQS